MNLEEFRRYGHALIDWLADYHETLAAQPVQAPTRPGAVRSMLPAEPPKNPEAFEACIADLDTIVAPNLSHWQHPRFFGYFPAFYIDVSDIHTFESRRRKVIVYLAGVLGEIMARTLGITRYTEDSRFIQDLHVR